jgi:hypothetical protein
MRQFPVFPESSPFAVFKSFARAYWRRLLGLSALVLIPCFWHREIAASDLGSHLYNAWLVQLIHRGQAPGLWVAPQYTNVLFDLLLSASGSVFGLRVGEKVAVSVAVLIFFWGAFALVSAASRRPPWMLAPCILLVTYGWTFHIGLFNYYLALGLSYFALAIWWRGKGWGRLASVAIAALVLVAHPLGFIWLLGAALYLGVAERISRPRYELLLFAAGVAALFLVHYSLTHRYSTDPGSRPFYSFNGADQLVLFSERYRILARALLAFAIVSLAVDLLRRRQESGLWKYYRIPVQLYILALLSVLLLPGAVDLPPPSATLALLTERLTAVTAVIGCALLGAMRLGRWHLAAGTAIAAVFFAFLYQDTAVVNKMEAQVVELVSTLPPNQRVMATILPLKDSRILLQHIIDRACIGRCFSYGNYEPGAAVFRVRALPGNPYVLTDYDLAVDMEQGNYIVEPQDLPVYQIYQCSESGTQLCIQPLEAGEDNDRLGVHLDQ